MFFSFLEDESIPPFVFLSAAAGAAATVAVYLQKYPRKGEGRALGEEKDGSLQGNPFVTPSSAPI